MHSRRIDLSTRGSLRGRKGHLHEKDTFSGGKDITLVRLCGAGNTAGMEGRMAFAKYQQSLDSNVIGSVVKVNRRIQH